MSNIVVGSIVKEIEWMGQFKKGSRLEVSEITVQDGETFYGIRSEGSKNAPLFDTAENLELIK